MWFDTELRSRPPCWCYCTSHVYAGCKVVVNAARVPVVTGSIRSLLVEPMCVSIVAVCDHLGLPNHSEDLRLCIMCCSMGCNGPVPRGTVTVPAQLGAGATTSSRPCRAPSCDQRDCTHCQTDCLLHGKEYRVILTRATRVVQQLRAQCAFVVVHDRVDASLCFNAQHFCHVEPHSLCKT
jgi:hypothetical protein